MLLILVLCGLYKPSYSFPQRNLKTREDVLSFLYSQVKRSRSVLTSWSVSERSYGQNNVYCQESDHYIISHKATTIRNGPLHVRSLSKCLRCGHLPFLTNFDGYCRSYTLTVKYRLLIVRLEVFL
jgi:hypothetical protein